MLLDYLLKPSVVQLSKLGQIMHICYHVAEYLFEIHVIILCRLLHESSLLLVHCLLRPVDDIVDVLLCRSDSLRNLLAFDMLKGENFVQLLFELPDETGFIVLLPRPSRWLWIVFGWHTHVWSLQAGLEVIIGDVVGGIVSDKGGVKLMTESDRVSHAHVAMQGMLVSPHIGRSRPRQSQEDTT